MIQIKDLREIISNFQLVLHDGDKAVIIGEEGNGKSTILKWLYDPALVEAYTDSEGIRVLGAERLGYLPQELPRSDYDKTIYEFFSEALLFFDKSPKELAEMANKFRVEPDFYYYNQPMASLSGGEKIKVQLMRLLIDEPTVLLLDEPSNDIDIETLELLETIIQEWRHIVLFISHDETLIEKTANIVIHIEQIRRKTRSRYTVVKKTYREYVEERLHTYKRQEQQALNELPEQEQAIFFKLGSEESKMPAGRTVLEYSLEELKTPDETRTLARDIFLRVRGAEKVCIVGVNGRGKTTLLKKIAASLTERKDLSVEYMPQSYDDLLELDQNPVDFLDTTGDKEERTKIRTYLGALKYTTEEMEHPMREFSGGQKAKVLLLKISLSNANVLILDEPTRNFSPLSGPVIRQMIASFPGAVISISHDRKYIEESCDKVYRLTEEGLREA